MKFHALPPAQAAGKILAHNIPALRLRKGIVLAAEHIAQLESIGLEQVYIADIEAGDMHEDAAAIRLGEAIITASQQSGDGSTGAPYLKLTEFVTTGRCNIIAAADGVLQYESGEVHKFNRIHEAITIACLRPDVVVTADDVVATVKIMPFACPAEAVEEAAAVGLKMRCHPFQNRRYSLLQTVLDAAKPSLQEKAINSMRQRVTQLHGTWQSSETCAHTQAAVEGALDDPRLAETDVLLLLGNSLTADRQDIIPRALEARGATVRHFGVPVDPGNFLMLALWPHPDRHLPRIVVVLPGCARSPKPNSIDTILARIAADLPLDWMYLTSLGVGGLLLESPFRRTPRQHAPVKPTGKASIGAVVLAAGKSTRFGGDKLTAPLPDGTSLLSRCIENIAQAGTKQVYVVCGENVADIENHLSNFSCAADITFVTNLGVGMASSLISGLRALPSAWDGALICLADMPAIRPQTIRTIIESFDSETARVIVPTYRDTQGHPLLIGRTLWGEVCDFAKGDRGAKGLIQQWMEQEEFVRTLACEDHGILLDIDDQHAWHEFAQHS